MATFLSTSAVTVVACKLPASSVRFELDVEYNRCYWWPTRRPRTDQGKHEMGLNTSNINPEALKFVDRKYEYSQMLAPLRSKDTAHPDDLAEY